MRRSPTPAATTTARIDLGIKHCPTQSPSFKDESRVDCADGDELFADAPDFE
jgi:hypothetical protein